MMLWGLLKHVRGWLDLKRFDHILVRVGGGPQQEKIGARPRSVKNHLQIQLTRPQETTSSQTPHGWVCGLGGTLQDSQEEFGGRGTEATYSDAPSSESAGLDFGHSPYATRSYHGALEHLSTCVFKDEETKKMYIKKYKLVELLKNKGFLSSIQS